jgi:hypothetical protein
MCYHIAWGEVTQMADHARSGDENGTPDAPCLQGTDDGCETIEAYETDEGVVLYDARNPLAWLKATHALDLADQA